MYMTIQKKCLQNAIEKNKIVLEVQQHFACSEMGMLIFNFTNCDLYMKKRCQFHIIFHGS